MPNSAFETNRQTKVKYKTKYLKKNVNHQHKKEERSLCRKSPETSRQKKNKYIYIYKLIVLRTMKVQKHKPKSMYITARAYKA